MKLIKVPVRNSRAATLERFKKHFRCCCDHNNDDLFTITRVFLILLLHISLHIILVYCPQLNSINPHEPFLPSALYFLSSGFLLEGGDILNVYTNKIFNIKKLMVNVIAKAELVFR